MKAAKTITMLDLRKNARMIVREVADGETYLLSYRGKPVAELKPAGGGKVKGKTRYKRPPKDDPFYRLADLAEDMGPSISNKEIDKIVYGI